MQQEITTGYTVTYLVNEVVWFAFCGCERENENVHANYLSFQLWEKCECLQNMVVKLISIVFFLKFQVEVSPTLSVFYINN